MPREPMFLQVPGLTMAEVHCSGEGIGWSAEEPVCNVALVLVRTGLFRRRVNGVEHLADAVTGYVQRPGTVQQTAHPRGGDVCTAIAPTPIALGSLLERPIRDDQVLITPALDLAHRVLVARARAGADGFELAERATVLTGEVVAGLVDADGSIRRGTWRRHRRLVDRVREALDDDSRRGLDELAGLAGISSYHLSRVFRLVTGLTLTRYRTRLRLRRAIERLSAGHTDLAGLAAELGFADQAHLTRQLRTEIGLTPGAVRALFEPAAVPLASLAR